MSDRPNATLGPISEQEILQFFEEFRGKSTVRKRPIPEVRHCVKIAQVANMFLVSRLEPSGPILGVLNSSEDVIRAGNGLRKELKKYIARLNEFSPAHESGLDSDLVCVALDDAERASILLKSVSDYLDAEGVEIKSPRFRGLEHIRRAITNAWENTGRQNISKESDGGPVNFVLEKIIFRMTGKNVKASTLGRAKRRQKKTKEIA